MLLVLAIERNRRGDIMPTESAKPKKPKIVIETNCPHCGKGIIVKRHRERTVDPVPAEYEEWTTVEKDSQAELPLEGTVDDPKPPKKTRKVGGTSKSGGKKPHEAVRT
jgi:hypothetical protein